jgi:hypothetical protein
MAQDAQLGQRVSEVVQAGGNPAIARQNTLSHIRCAEAKREAAQPEAFGISKGNMYLAEDRILGFELLTVPGKKWRMRYIKGAVAHVDPVDDLEGLIKQRRRWLNGSFFASWHTLKEFRGRVFDDFFACSVKNNSTAHGLIARLGLTCEFGFYGVTQLMTVLLLSVRVRLTPPPPPTRHPPFPAPLVFSPPLLLALLPFAPLHHGFVLPEPLARRAFHLGVPRDADGPGHRLTWRRF